MELTDRFNMKKVTKDNLVLYKDYINEAYHYNIKENNGYIEIEVTLNRDYLIEYNRFIIITLYYPYATPKTKSKYIVLKDTVINPDTDTNKYKLIAKEINIINVPDDYLT